MSVSNAGTTVAMLAEKNISNQSFYIPKAEVTVTQKNTAVRFTANIRFRKPDSLMVIVKSKVGLEAGRALITKNQVYINDRINRQMLTGDTKAIEQKYGIVPSLLFVVLGDFIIDDNEQIQGYSCLKGIYSDSFNIDSKKIEYKIDCNKMKPVQAYFEGDIKTGNITIDFRNIIDTKAVRFPQNIEINDDLNSIKINLEIKKIDSPWEGKINFVPGAGYKVIRVR